MSTNPGFPDFGRLLAPILGQIDEGDRPRFLALLERGAAERYRDWAREMPEHAELLDHCARSEDEIADRIEKLYALSPEAGAAMEAALPEARTLYLGTFEGKPLEDQLRIQANAERQGAAAWRAIASTAGDPAVRAELEACAALEEASADRLDALLA